MSETVSFSSKVDPWLIVLLVVSLGGSVAAVAAGAREAPAATAAGGAILLGSFVLVACVSVPTRYVVTRDRLVVRSGLLRYEVPLDSIRRVYPTNNLQASPAWSLDRLGIRYGPGRVGSLLLISPSDRERFLDLLRERAGLEARGRELRRPDTG